ncbi:MAG: 4-phosphopantetheinyl transferase, partial [Actinomycetota bacterium]|nr:4-phosphopantetheinyl transferase [Actinomycetota bacterium]
MSTTLDTRERAYRDARRTDAARRYVVAHGALREILGALVAADPATLRYKHTCAVCGSHEHGRPELAGIAGAPSFSLSHSGDVAVVAVSTEQVGADVEVVRARRYLDRIAQRTLRADEYSRWESLRDDEQVAAFLRSWTAKEAYLKMLGVGLTRALREIPTHDAQTWLDWP